MSYYHKALSRPVALLSDDRFDRRVEDTNVGASMFVRGMFRGQERRKLYSSGISGESVAMVISGESLIGAEELFPHGIMHGITGFLVDVAHVLLMIGGLYLLVSSMQ